MTTLTDSNHVTQTIDAYLAGGLDEAERRAVEAHLAACPDCRVALELARQADRRLADAFAAGRLPADYEQRVVDRLRRGLGRGGVRGPISWPRLAGRATLGKLRPGAAHPAVRRIATAAAAALVLGAVGFGVQSARQAREAAEAEGSTVGAYGSAAASAAEARVALADARRHHESRSKAGEAETGKSTVLRGTGFQQQRGEPAIRGPLAADADFDAEPNFSLSYAKPSGAQAFGSQPNANEPAVGGQVAQQPGGRVAGGAGPGGGGGEGDSYRYFRAETPAVAAGRVKEDYLAANQFGERGAGGPSSGTVDKAKGMKADLDVKRSSGVEAMVQSSHALARTAGDASGPGGGGGGGGAVDKLSETAAADRRKLAGAKPVEAMPGAAKPVAGAPTSTGGDAVAGTAIAPWADAAGVSTGRGVNWAFDGASGGPQGAARGFGGGGGGSGASGPNGGAVNGSLADGLATGTSGPVALLKDGEDAVKKGKDFGRPGGAADGFGVQLGLGGVPPAGGQPGAGVTFYNDAVTHGQAAAAPAAGVAVPGGLSVVTSSSPGGSGGPGPGAAGPGAAGPGAAGPGAAGSGTAALTYKQELLEAPKVVAGTAFRPAELLARPESETAAGKGRGAVRQPVAAGDVVAGKFGAPGQPEGKVEQLAKEVKRPSDAKQAADPTAKPDQRVVEAEAASDPSAFASVKPRGGDADKAADGLAAPATPPPGAPSEAAGPSPRRWHRRHPRRARPRPHRQHRQHHHHKIPRILRQRRPRLRRLRSRPRSRRGRSNGGSSATGTCSSRSTASTAPCGR